MAARSLQNRLIVATALWRESVDEPLPKLDPGEPEQQIGQFELKVVEALMATASRANARDIADKTWDLVHDRSDDDPVRKRVVEAHEELARLGVDLS